MIGIIRWIQLTALLLTFLISPHSSDARTVQGKVTLVQEGTITLNIGSREGLMVNDSGRVYYHVRVDEKERPIYVAKFKITHLTVDSCVAQIEAKTSEVRVGLFAEVTIKEGKLDIRSEPSGGTVYIDQKKMGETPLLFPGIRTGQHVVRVIKDGYEPYEGRVDVAEEDTKRINAVLKRKTGALLVRTNPPGASVFIDGKSVGMSPYEGNVSSLGAHRLAVKKPGYEVWERDIEIIVGKRTEVLAQLKILGGGKTLDGKSSAEKRDRHAKGSGDDQEGEKTHVGAISLPDTATESELTPVSTLVLRGMTHHEKGEYDLAISEYSKALEVDPRYAEAEGAATAKPERVSKEDLDELMEGLGPKVPLN